MAETKIDLPSGESLWFIGDDHPDPNLRHSYWRHNPKTGQKGRRLTGVTTACKVLDYDASRLLNWSARTQCIGIAERYAMGGETTWLTTAESIWRELKAHSLTFEDVRELAAAEGTNVHREAFQALAEGRPVPDLDALSERERGLARAVMAFWLDHDPIAQQVEQVVYSERLGVAGRLDFRGVLDATCENDVCPCHEVQGPGVIDLKTGGYISEAADEQVGGGYPLLAEESEFGPSEWALILKVSDDGTYRLIPARGTPEGFEKAVAAYREAGRIKREKQQAWKAEQKALAAA